MFSDRMRSIENLEWGETGQQWWIMLSSICTRSKLCRLYAIVTGVYWLMFLIEFTQLSIFLFVLRSPVGCTEWNIVDCIQLSILQHSLHIKNLIHTLCDDYIPLIDWLQFIILSLQTYHCCSVAKWNLMLK